MRLVVFLIAATFRPAGSNSPVPFHDWSSPHEVSLRGAGGTTAWVGAEATANVVGSSGRQMHLLPQLLSGEEIASLHAAAQRCDAFTAEPDTVDKEATYQAYIFEDGEPARGAASEVAQLIQPIIEARILPYVRAKYDCPTACLADALLRRYQKDERTSLGLHYDIEAFATAIIPLSVQQQADQQPAAQQPADPALLTTYEGGLFVQGGASQSSRRLVRFASAGDVLLHQFDVMHGVSLSGGTRYAVALWFSDSPEARAMGTAPWVADAALCGNADAQFLQATFAAQGRFGNAQDDTAAAAWLQRGATQGHALSQLGLGRLHLSGAFPGGSEPKVAVANFRLAAEQGHVEAQYALGLCYLDGNGARRSLRDALHWFGLAAEQGGEYGEAAALERDEVEEMLRTKSDEL